jgi:hypothetical protein
MKQPTASPTATPSAARKYYAGPDASPHERADKGTLQKEGKHSFHRKRLPDTLPEYFENDAQFARTEIPLKSRHDAYGEIQTEHPRPNLTATLQRSSPVRNARHFQ